MTSPTDFIWVVKTGLGLGKLFKRPAGNLGHHIIDRRLEAGRCLAGDVIADLVEPIADGKLGGDLGDRKPGRLAGQGAAAADPRIHLDHDHPPGLRINRELDV